MFVGIRIVSEFPVWLFSPSYLYMMSFLKCFTWLSGSKLLDTADIGTLLCIYLIFRRSWNLVCEKFSILLSAYALLICAGTNYLQ